MDGNYAREDQDAENRRLHVWVVVLLFRWLERVVRNYLKVIKEASNSNNVKKRSKLELLEDRRWI